MDTNFENGEFDTIVSCSVIEHQVDFKKFAKECGRLLRIGGNLCVSFDYFNPKPDTSKMKLYSLDWNILDRQDVLNLILSLL
jgi:2-polyprenyl-3-methyl-5-hydroxy-6-metoxy-1,4-benzoquinol methylase